MKKTIGLILFCFLIALRAQAQLVTMYDLVLQSVEKDVAPRTEKRTFKVPKQDIQVTIWIKKPQPRGLEEILIPTVATFEFNIQGKKHFFNATPIKDYGDDYNISLIEKVGNRNICLNYSTVLGKCIYSFFDDPIIPDPMQEYQDKIKALGF